MRRCFLLFIWFCVFGNTAGLSQKAEKITLPGSGLDNFYRVDSGVYRADQPSAIAFKMLDRFGIKEILNLRNWHSDADEAEGTSLRLHRLKTRASKIDERDIVKALRIIKNRQGSVLIHCWHGSDRTGAVIAMYRIVFQGWSKENAIKEMTGGGFGFHEQFSQIIDMINRADIESIKRRLEAKPKYKNRSGAPERFSNRMIVKYYC